MKNKVCSRCKIEQPIESFGIKNAARGTRNAWCSECNKEYNKIHYQKNKDVYYNKTKAYKRMMRQYVYDYLSAHPCVICGEDRVPALQFDHLDRNEKSFNISTAGKHTGIEKLNKEIKKCRVLCANCHAIHTAEQLGWYKDLNI